MAALAEWQGHFAEAAPGLAVHWWDDPAVDPAQVHYAFPWEPEPGRLAALPNLRLVLSPGAGVDHITRDPAWPAHLPLVRMGGEETGAAHGRVCLPRLPLAAARIGAGRPRRRRRGGGSSSRAAAARRR